MDVTYVEQVAEQIRDEVAGSDLPEENTRLLFRIYAVLLLAKGEDVVAADVHNAWVAWMCSIDPTHESLIPFEQLSHDVARMDDSYVDAIRRVAARMAGSDAERQ